MADSSVKLNKKNKRKLLGTGDKQNLEKKHRVCSSKEEAERVEVGEASAEWEEDLKLEEGRPWRNLKLILLIQNKEVELQRKVELVYNYVVPMVDGGNVMDNDDQIVSLSRIIVFVNDWIQSLLIYPEKKVKVHGNVETCLDFRCWRIFKFCLEESLTLQIRLNFARNLLRTIGYIARSVVSLFSETSFSPKELSLTAESLELYNAVLDCVSMLFSSQNGLSNENLDSWILTTVALLELVHKIHSINLEDAQIGIFSLKLSCLVLDSFLRFLKIHPTRKNGFHDFVDKLLEPLLQLIGVSHFRIIKKTPSQSSDLLKLVEEVLAQALFHPIHLEGFLGLHSTERYGTWETGRTKESNLVPKSYHRHFFKKIEKIMAEKNVLIMSSIGELLPLFADHVGKKKGDSVLSGGAKANRNSGSSRHLKEDLSNHNSSDQSWSISSISVQGNIESSSLNMQTQKPVFDFFIQVLEPLLLQMKCYGDPNVLEGRFLSNAYCILRSLNSILYGVIRAKVYVGAEDVSEGSCLNFLKNSYEILISYATKLLNLSNSHLDTEMQEIFFLSSKELFISVKYFFIIEYKAVANDLDSVWLMMLAYLSFGTSVVDSPDYSLLTSPILSLACQLFDLYTSLRQVHIPIFALCKAVRLLIQQKNDGEVDSGTLLSCVTSFCNQAIIKAVAVLLCSQETECAIRQAVKSLPEGQVSEFIQQLTIDVAESLDWMKINYTDSDEVKSGRFNVADFSMNVSDRAEVLGRMLSEIYVLLLDSLTVTTGNCNLLGISMRELINIIHRYVSNLAGLQPDGVKKFLSSTTGSSESTLAGDGNKKGIIPNLWIFVFFFRLYMSMRSSSRKIISIVPPNMLKKMSTIMGDVFATYTGWDWMTKTEWTDKVKFSWADHSLLSLLDLLHCISDIYAEDGEKGCSPLVYMLLTLALQRLVDLNGRLNSLKYLLHFTGNLSQDSVLSDTNLAVDNKKMRKLRKQILILEKEAEGLTEFMLGYLSLVNDCQLCSGDANRDDTSLQTHVNSGWDLGVCSVNKNTLPTAIWWVLCQNVDIWCIHATSKKLKKFLTLLISTSIPCLSGSFKQVGKHITDGTGLLRKVTLHQISAELLRDAALYENQFVRRNVTSRLCKVLEISVLSFLPNLSNPKIDFHSLPNWPVILSSLEMKHAWVVESISKSSAKLHQDVSADCETLPLVNMKSGHCRALLDLLCWMPKEYLSMKSFSRLGIFILNLERCLIAGLLDYHDKLNLLDYYELLHLFVACRRTLKNIMVAEAGSSSLLSVVNEDSFFMSWISKSVHLVIQLMSSTSLDNEHSSKLAIVSLMDHTSYILLIISNHLVGRGAPVCGKTDDQYREPYSGEIAEKSLKKSEGFRSSCAFDESLKEEAECLLSSLKDVRGNSKAGVQDSLVHVNKLSLTVSCFCGYLWGLSCALEQMGQRSGEFGNRKGQFVRKLVPKLKLCTNVFGNLMNTFMQMLCIQNDPDHRSSYGSGKSCPQKPSDEPSRESESRKSLSAPFNTNDELNSTHETCCQIENAKRPPVLTKVDLMELSGHTKNLLRGLLKGDLPEKAISLRQLLIALSAMLRLNRHVDSIPLCSKSISIFVAISQFLLSEFANSVEMVESFSFVWLDGALKFLEELGLHFPSAKFVLSEQVYLKLIMLHLSAMGKCISLQGKRATLESHGRELNHEIVHDDGRLSEKLLYHDQHRLQEFKVRLRTLFKVYLENSSELHLLAALQTIERTLIGIQEDCKMIYDINTIEVDGGKVSSTVAAAIDCLNLLLECATDRKCISMVRRHIQSFGAGLFNIVLHLQGPSIFFREVGKDKSNNAPDPGSVILMCVEVLTRISAKHALFQMDSWYIAQSLRIPGALFYDICHEKTSEEPASGTLLFSDDPDNHGVTNSRYHVIDMQFSAHLFTACCQLLYTVVKHYKSECERCLAVLEESVFVLLHCFEATDAKVGKGFSLWEVEDGVKCARSFRRIYEEIRQQKEIFAKHCVKFLSNYIWVYSGNGTLKTGFKREVDEALRPGVYALIDACSANDLQYLHTAFGEGPCRNTLASLRHDYKLNFQYEGKV